MYVERIPNRNSPPAILLRESYRDGDKIRKRTLANLSDWPASKIEALRCVLRGDAVAPVGREALSMQRSLAPRAYRGGARDAAQASASIGCSGRPAARWRWLSCMAMIVARLIAPASKLATARVLDDETATCSLGQVLGLGAVDEEELYGALDWLVERQPAIEKALARRHLRDGTLVLYDVSLELCRGPLLRAGKVRAQSRRQEGQAADRLRPAVRRTAARSRSRSSRAIPAIPRRCRPRSTS